MIKNQIQSDKGRKVVSIASTGSRLAADFPGWGAADYGKYLLPFDGGLKGVVTNVESHGSFPYTRYSVRFADGSTASGLVAGKTINFTK